MGRPEAALLDDVLFILQKRRSILLDPRILGYDVGKLSSHEARKSYRYLAGAQVYLTKPFKTAELLAVVQAQLGVLVSRER